MMAIAVFTKLASQLNADKLIELAVIPIIFVIQTLVSYLVATIVSKAFRFNRRASNFVTAMGVSYSRRLRCIDSIADCSCTQVFGNSNSLPISLVISLSQTLKGLHWDKIPGDNDDEVAARGILYLMIFQQLGQLVRWSWGYHVLLAPKDKYEEYNNESVEEGRFGGDAMGTEETEGLIEGMDAHGDDDFHDHSAIGSDDSEAYEPAGRTPVVSRSRTSLNGSENGGYETPKKQNGLNGHGSSSAYPLPEEEDDLDDGILSFPRIRQPDEPEIPAGIKGIPTRFRILCKKTGASITNSFKKLSHRIYSSLPRPVQVFINVLYRAWIRIYAFLWDFMNPPLWAMLIAVIVASVPDLQRLFFEEGSFIKNSVTSAVTQSAGVAVPLILVVLGANLARNTQKREGTDPEEAQIGTRLLVASLISRMLLPTIIMAPILAIFAKYVPVSILDDPIFVIVCFLLTGAPSALQLAQICQINSVYENVMSRILFQSYVIW